MTARAAFVLSCILLAALALAACWALGALLEAM
jgi:hypothetical protein